MSAYSSFSSMNFSCSASWSNSAGEMRDRIAANNTPNPGCEGCAFSRLGPAPCQILDQNAGLPDESDFYAASFPGFVVDFPGLYLSSCAQIRPASHLRITHQYGCSPTAVGINGHSAGPRSLAPRSVRDRVNQCPKFGVFSHNAWDRKYGLKDGKWAKKNAARWKIGCFWGKNRSDIEQGEPVALSIKIDPPGFSRTHRVTVSILVCVIGLLALSPSQGFRTAIFHLLASVVILIVLYVAVAFFKKRVDEQLQHSGEDELCIEEFTVRISTFDFILTNVKEIQDVHQDLSGRIFKDSQYPFARGGNSHIYRGHLIRPGGLKNLVGPQPVNLSSG
ncbi:hypothetical protein B0H11DRAFT_1898564 [Mycena galericulata]|nr:hypothetical protein B0H11DRAFT_1898564 [Mycena galericulata]